MTKDEKKKMLRQLKEQQAQAFEKSLPMSRSHFEKLFDYLDNKLAEGCAHNHAFTMEYLKSNGIAQEPVLCWLRENGGYCDCEVLANVEEKFL